VSLSFYVGKGIEPLGSSVKKTVLRTVFSERSCGSSSEWFSQSEKHVDSRPGHKPDSRPGHQKYPLFFAELSHVNRISKKL
jgi:hypothetical protein